MIKKFTKKPVEVEALKNDRYEDPIIILRFLGGSLVCYNHQTREIQIKTLEDQVITVFPGDWVIKSYYPAKDIYFYWATAQDYLNEFYTPKE